MIAQYSRKIHLLPVHFQNYPVHVEKGLRLSLTRAFRSTRRRPSLVRRLEAAAARGPNPQQHLREARGSGRREELVLHRLALSCERASLTVQQAEPLATASSTPSDAFEGRLRFAP